MRHEHWDAIVIGGGAAGFFAAVTLAESIAGCRVLILEKGREVLQKVRISGGGRCNVTHACFDPAVLIDHYPRGSRELLGPFHRFGPSETVEWFEHRGVRLKTEADGRMFPSTDDSATIVECLTEAARKNGVTVRTSAGVRAIIHAPDSTVPWVVDIGDRQLTCRILLVATGSSPAVWDMLSGLGLRVVPPVPSLFTFNIKDKPLNGLAGVSVPLARVKVIGEANLVAEGPLLITHWGLSGPAILRLSAWGARVLNDRDYTVDIQVQWCNGSEEDFHDACQQQKQEAPRRRVANKALGGLPLRLWQYLVARAGISEVRTWAELRHNEQNALRECCFRCVLSVRGKSTFKEEFVTAGGVELKEVNFTTFGVRRLPGLFLAGEVLNIDAITGGFNFQAAWTGGYISGCSMASLLR